MFEIEFVVCYVDPFCLRMIENCKQVSDFQVSERKRLAGSKKAPFEHTGIHVLRDLLKNNGENKNKKIAMMTKL